MLKKLVAAGGWVFVGILLGRIAGFVRDQLIAAQFGRSSSADVATLTVRIPDLLLSIIVGGAMGAALIPEFKRRGAWDVWQLHKQASKTVFMAMVPLTAVLVLAVPLIVKAFGPGFQPATASEAESLIRIVLWAIPLSALVAIDRAFLQSLGDFAISSMSTVVYNLALVAGLLTPIHGQKLTALAVAAVIGAGLNVAIQRTATRKRRPAERGESTNQIDRGLLTRYGHAFMAGGLLLILPSIALAVSSLDAPGSLAILNYALKTVELPLGVVLTVYSVVLFPTLSELFAKPESLESGVQLARRGMSVVFVMSISIAMAMAWFNVDFARVLFKHGALDDAAAQTVGALARVALIGMTAQALYSIVLATLNALQDMRSPFYGTIVALVCYVPLALVGRATFGLAGIVGAAVCVYWGLLIGLLVVAKRKHSVNVYATLVSAPTLASGCACVAAFAPFAAISRLVHLGAYAHIGLALAGGVAAASAGLLSLPEVRQRLQRRLRPASSV